MPFIFGSDDQDVLIGKGEADSIFGFGQNDALFGGKGADNLFGGDGNDLLSGSDPLPADSDGAVDQLTGGRGNDRYFIFDGLDVVHEDAGPGSGFDTVQFESFSYKAENNVENLQFERDAVQGIGNELANRMTVTKADDDSAKLMDGRGGNDNLTSAEGDDKLFGGEGADFMTGNGGNDLLDGGAGNDNMRGQDGVDTMKGGAGFDFMFGGLLGDVMTGGSERDIFSYSVLPGESQGNIAATRDTITDFQVGTDKIQLGNDANPNLPGQQDFTFIGGAGFSAAGQVRVFRTGEGTFVQASNDGDATAELTIKLDGQHFLTGNDFFL